jgi:hypothetical protein
MRDVTSVMNEYRECSRHLWNSYFGGLVDHCGRERAYEQIRKLLFEALVSQRLERQEGAESTLRVVPMKSLPVLIRRQSEDANYYWDEARDLQSTSGNNELIFVDYYDFFQGDVVDFRFYRCRVSQCSARPEYVGREALVDVVHAQVFCGESD